MMKPFLKKLFEKIAQTPKAWKGISFNGSNNWTGKLRNWMLTFCSLSLIVRLGTLEIGRGAGALRICLIFAEFRVVYHQNCFPSPNIILLP